MVDYRVVVAGLLGIGPALAFLFHAMRRYDVPFVDKPLFDSSRLFMLFAGGMIFGGASAFMSFTFPPASDLLILLALLIGFALFEELFKFVVVNLKQFQLKYETTFYGLSLGVGVSSITMLMTSFILMPVEFDNATAYVAVALAAVYSISVCSLHASTGSYIGYGSATGYVWNYFVQAMIARIAFAVMIIPFILGTNQVLSAISMVVAAVFSILLYVHVYTRILPETLPDKEKKRKRRTIRKMKFSS
ncbi:MAG: hypothetical protein KAR39_03305 [Thermoplasmata archaeon]|nr:hypothetical protein [Thermoplasmata archaeon]